MTNMGMEVDTSSHLELDHSVDADLIDYDHDQAEANQDVMQDQVYRLDEGPADANEAPEPVIQQESSEFQTADADDILEEDRLLGASHETISPDITDKEGLQTAEGKIETAPAKQNHDEEIDFFDTDNHTGTEAANNVGSLVGQADKGDTHEIDYDHDDAPSEATTRNVERGEDDDKAATAIVAEDEGAYGRTSSGSESDTHEAVTAAEHDDLSWEHHAEDDVGDSGLVDEATVHESNFDGVTDEQPSTINHDTDQHIEEYVDEQDVVTENAEDAENTEPAIDESIQDELNFDEENAHDSNLEYSNNKEILDEDSDLQHSDMMDGTGFPAVTVHYKDYEYPMFSSGPEGFFSETSILDESIDTLLAGFRVELANEIASEDDLVFQIDELGLEFAESTSQDPSFSINLRQVLDIFDTLVKNQDPGNSRTLYTYLFTRPNTSKRYETLLESAAAGKGLDEVIHLFVSPLHSRKLAESTAPSGTHDERPDEYESFDNDDGRSAEATSPQDVTEEGDEDVPEYFAEDTGFDEEHHDDSFQLEQEGNSEILDLVVPTVNGNGNDELAELANTGVSDSLIVPSEVYETDENDTNALLNLHIGASIVTDNVDIEEGDDLLTQSQPDDFIAPTDAADTTTTEVLDAIAGAASGFDDAMSVQAMEHEFAEEKARGENDGPEVVEIDWREEPAMNSGTAIVEETTSLVGKRNRTDDEPNVDVEQDAKRRRP